MKGAFITICLQVKGENGDKWAHCTMMKQGGLNQETYYTLSTDPNSQFFASGAAVEEKRNKWR